MAKKQKKFKIDWDEEARKRTILLQDLSTEQVMAAVNHVGGDGHTIFDIQVLIEKCGWPVEAALAVSKCYESGNSAKETIFGPDGMPLNQIYGWYGLDLLRSLAGVLKVKYEFKQGRGFQAQAIYAAMQDHFKEVAHV